jgi:hypothetical protein
LPLWCMPLGGASQSQVRLREGIQRLPGSSLAEPLSPPHALSPAKYDRASIDGTNDLSTPLLSAFSSGATDLTQTQTDGGYTSTAGTAVSNTISGIAIVLSIFGYLLGLVVVCLVALFVLVGVPLLFLAACDIDAGIDWKVVVATVKKQATNSWRRLRYVLYQRRRRRRRRSQVTHVSFEGGGGVVEDQRTGSQFTVHNALQPQQSSVYETQEIGMRGRQQQAPPPPPAQRL